MKRRQLHRQYRSYKNGVAGRPPTHEPPPLQKRPVGRPSNYCEGFAELAFKLRLFGLTVPRIAEVLGVDTSTIHRWRDAIPEFRKAWEEGGELADAEVARSLYRRANGYTHQAERVFCTKDGEIVRGSYTEHVPPDTRAAEWWLANRAPRLWRPPASKSLDVTDPDGRPLKPPTIQINVVSPMQMQPAQPEPRVIDAEPERD